MNAFMQFSATLLERLKDDEMILLKGGTGEDPDDKSPNNGSGLCDGSNNADGKCAGSNNADGKCGN